MKKMKKYYPSIFPVFLFVLVFASVTLSPGLVTAAPVVDSGKLDNFTDAQSSDVLSSVLTLTYTIVGAIAIMVIIGAGILYTISEGDSKKTQTAKDAILYAVIGLVIVGSAFIITGVVQNIGAGT